VTGAALRERRKAAGLTQAALAAKLGVTQAAVAQWERGKRPVPTMAGVALEAIRRGVFPLPGPGVTVAYAPGTVADPEAHERRIRRALEKVLPGVTVFVCESPEAWGFVRADDEAGFRPDLACEAQEALE
jgi:transcriptional regulator with XRE-family HTH domain